MTDLETKLAEALRDVLKHMDRPTFEQAREALRLYDEAFAATPAPSAQVHVQAWTKKGHGGTQEKGIVSVEVGGLRFYPMKNSGYGSPADYSLQEAESWAGKLREALATTPAPQVEGLQMEQEPKYTVNGSAIVNRASGKPIPSDEPVFVFRARDVHAMYALEAYAGMLPQGIHRDAVSRRVADFEAFARANPERMKQPDTTPAPSGRTDSIAFQYLRETVEKELQPVKDAFAQKNSTESPEPDPCPGCLPGTVCRTPKCGRLRKGSNPLPVGQKPPAPPNPPKAATPAPAPAPLTDEQIEGGRSKLFSVGNPYCPITEKAMRTAVRWAERCHGIGQGKEAT